VWPWPLTFWPRNWSFRPLAPWTNLHRNKFIRFQIIVFTSSMRDERTNERMDGRTDTTNWQLEKIPASLEGWRHKNPTENESEDWRQGFFSVAAPRIWNRLPADLKLLHSTASFRSKLKSFLFEAAYTGNTVWTLECAIGLIVGGALQVTVVTVTVSERVEFLDKTYLVC